MTQPKNKQTKIAGSELKHVIVDIGCLHQTFHVNAFVKIKLELYRDMRD